VPKWGSTNAYTEDEQGRPVYDWTILDRIFDSYRERGVRPYVQIGFMPKALSTQPDPYENRYFRGDWDAKDFRTGWAYPPKDYDKWRELVRRWAEHCAQRYGEAEAESWVWEVWNEPNGYWNGTREEFFKLYDYAVDGVRRALPGAKVAGPHTAGGPGGTWLKDFLEHCRSGANAATGGTGAPLDIIAFHAKGRPQFIDGHVRMGLAAELERVESALAVIADFPEFKHLPIVIGEADPDGKAARLAPELGYRQGTLYASYTAASFARFHELADGHGTNLQGAVTWAFAFEGKPFFEGYRVLSTNGIDLPILNVFRMFSRMGGQRPLVHSSAAYPAAKIIAGGVTGAPDVSALAGLESNRLSVLLWHYHDDDLPGPVASVELSLRGLPAGAANARITEHRIDATHSNAFEAWKRMGSPPTPSPGQYASLEQAGQLAAAAPPAVSRVSDGTSRLRLALPRQSVVLITLEW
jgi:xylan 1,4-beta-xylosidase